jgi:F-type H+-transporting ATPase subunit epsilon
MAASLLFELVSPEKLLLSQPVGMVVVPGSEGNFGVLPGHALFISTVRPGIIDVYDDGAVTERIFVSGGFAEVTPERCTVLADEAVPVASLDRATIEGQVKTDESTSAVLREQMQRASGTERDDLLLKLRAAERQLAVAAAKLAAIGAVH